MAEIGSAVTNSNKRCGEHGKTLIVDEGVKVGGFLVRHGADPGAGAKFMQQLAGDGFMPVIEVEFIGLPYFPVEGPTPSP